MDPHTATTTISQMLFCCTSDSVYKAVQSADIQAFLDPNTKLLFVLVIRAVLEKMGCKEV